MHSECKTKQSHKAAHHGFAVFGIRYSQANQPSLQATGEWVGDEKIAERRVATKARITSQSSPRVFSEIFCSTHPERGARQPTWQVPQSETSARQLRKLPRARIQPADCASSTRHAASPANCTHSPGTLREFHRQFNGDCENTRKECKHYLGARLQQDGCYYDLRQSIAVCFHAIFTIQ